MELLEWIIITVASLGALFGLGILIRSLLSSDRETIKKIVRSPAALLTMLTILSCILAYSFDNFFYDFPAVPLLIGAFAVMSLSRRSMMASVNRGSRWLSVLFALVWGIWSFCVFMLLVVILIPDYPGLNQYTVHKQMGFAYMLVGLAVAVMIFSSAANLYIGIRATGKQRKEDN